MHLSPSGPARQLFSKMVARGDGESISLEETVKLAVERSQRGEEDPAAHMEIHELLDEQWIRPDHDNGGWLLT
jgi:hypothetical protein